MTKGGLPRQQLESIALNLFQVSKTYRHCGDERRVLRDFSLSVLQGEVLSVLGASGCGKTTLLNIISGIEDCDSGVVDTGASRIGYMFQTDLLLPWRTAEDNALLGLELTGSRDSPDSLDKARAYFERLGLTGVEDDYPAFLSGGMKQRVAIIRTLLYDPDVLLLDEPFSALDYDAKLLLESFLLDFVREKGRTAVFVTHDIDEAIAVGSRLVVLKGSPSTGQPANIILDHRISFAGDAGGRDPVRAREDPRFSQYFSKVYGALKLL